MHEKIAILKNDVRYDLWEFEKVKGLVTYNEIIESVTAYTYMPQTYTLIVATLSLIIIQ